jgi:hypothetical protein
MAITKSNKHKLSFDHDKPNEKGGCTLATPYALMRSLILDSQISITPLGSCTSLYSKGISQLNKWARVLRWTSRRSIYTTHFKTYPLGSNSAAFRVTGRTSRSDRTCQVSTPLPSPDRWPLGWPDSWLSQVPENPLWCWPDSLTRVSGLFFFSASG